MYPLHILGIHEQTSSTKTTSLASRNLLPGLEMRKLRQFGSAATILAATISQRWPLKHGDVYQRIVSIPADGHQNDYIQYLNT